MKNTTEVKLSEKQKEVILLMRQGKALYTIFYSTGSPNVINGKRVIEPTFSKLSNLGLITFDRSAFSNSLQRSYYKLTELGKTMHL